MTSVERMPRQASHLSTEASFQSLRKGRTSPFALFESSRLAASHDEFAIFPFAKGLNAFA
jgi:hypothetical protein